MNLEVQQLGARDERLDFLLQQVKEATKVFMEALDDSSPEQVGVSFKAFSLKTNRKEEAEAIFDVIMSAFAIELAKERPAYVKEYTFYHSIEWEEDPALLWHCRKVPPPSKEEIEAMTDKKDTEAMEAEATVAEADV